MKLIIAGSRTFNFFIKEHSTDISYLDSLMSALNIPFPNEVICGCGGTNKEKVEELRKEECLVSDQGIDLLGEYWADSNGIKIERFPADWKKYNRSAGPIRNKEMAEYAEALLLIWDGKSKGSQSMKNEMLKLNKPIYEVILRKY